jgi:hypothetical protein
MDIFGSVAIIFNKAVSWWVCIDRLSINVKRLEYNSVRGDFDGSTDLVYPRTSRYYAKLGFSNSGQPKTIRYITLEINSRLTVEAEDFVPLKLEPVNYREIIINFPIKENLAVRKGAFEIRATDSSNGIHRCKGQFPICG